MKKVGSLNIAFTFIGSILGAGFVSGNELWLYFGSYGIKGVFGLFLSLCLLAIFATLTLWVAGKDDAVTIDRVLFTKDAPAVLREGTGVLFVFFYFCVCVVMIAGISSLAESLLGFPGPAAGAVTTVCMMIVAWYGVAGLTGVFSVSIPVLIVFAIAISLIRIFGPGSHSVVFSEGATSPLLGNFLVSSVNYTSLNLFGAIGIVAPLAPYVKSKKTVPAGMGLGAILLISIAYSILFALATSPESVTTDLPMLDLSVRMGNTYGVTYGLLLFLGMFGSAFSTMFAVVQYLKVRFPKFSAKPLPGITVLAGLAYLLSLLGFSDLVGILYPFMGYVGIAAMGLLLYRAFKITRAAAP